MAHRHLQAPLLTLAGLLGLTGCHSAMVDATVQNRSGDLVTLVEVDYPSASFGDQNLASGADFHYRFKILGSGALKMTYTDIHRQTHSSTGPVLEEQAEGLLTITIMPTDVRWQTTLKQKQ